jgi:hypothetical protein
MAAEAVILTCVPTSNLAMAGGMPPKRSQAVPFVVEEACLRCYWAERTWVSTHTALWWYRRRIWRKGNGLHLAAYIAVFAEFAWHMRTIT